MASTIYVQCFPTNQQQQQQQQESLLLRTCQARQQAIPPQQGTTTTTTTSVFTSLPTRLPPPPLITRRNRSARASSIATLNVQQEKTTETTINNRQPSLYLTTQEYQVNVHVQPTEPPLALDSISPVNTTTDIPIHPFSNNTLHLDINPEPTTLMEFNFDINMNMESVDWDQFLVDADLGEAQIPPMANSNGNSPASSDSQAATPKSTESEQSAALDPENDFDFNFDFDLPTVGITHRPEDIFNPVQPLEFIAPAVDIRGTSDPTMINTFGLSFGDFGLHTDLGADAASELGLTNLLGKLGDHKTVETAPTASPINDLNDAYALLDKLLPPTSSPSSIQPSQLALPSSPVLKRKSSDDIEEGAPATKKRGRPPGSAKAKPLALQDPKRAYRRQSTVLSCSPALSADSVADESEADSPVPQSSPAVTVKKTISGKPSTARPKSVVPEKFLKDGSAQAILGMDINQIQSYPSFDMLLKDVDPSRLTAATEFGERIADNRDKAKDAAKKSRDERRAKIERSEFLEKKVEDLEIKLKGMTSVLLALVDRGILGKDQVASFL
ncbi:uncharacterized protein L201_001408 [Kwoniella dendrophila CBS 6074]|uniref:BZIP domain-containing protein n=1 Tax=Kwoniella dendrophila CBS 6074 TaxID=1295534 RepID=A0AAX4JM76_9TREE